MTIIRYIKNWIDFPENGTLVEADTEREVFHEYITPSIPGKRGYIQIYDHNGFKLLKDYSDTIPYGLRVKLQVER